MKPVVIFGSGPFAQLAQFYLGHDSDRDVVAFTADARFVESDTAYGLPLVAFEDILNRYPPDGFDMIVAIGYSQMNKVREEKFNAAKTLGYQLVSYVSSTATTWPGLKIGENCFIMERNVIQPFVTVGNNVTMWSGCQIAHESVIMDHCYLAAHVVVSGDVTIEPNCFVGVNATLRDGIRIGRESVIGAGAVILGSTQPKGVYAGSKARLLPMPSDRLPNL